MINICIVGVGKLGICYAIILAKAGYKVFIYDINKIILDNIKNNTYNYNEPELNDIYNNCNIIFTYIQTPSLDNGLYNHEYINNFIDEILEQSQKLKLIILLAKNKNKVIIYGLSYIIKILKNNIIIYLNIEKFKLR